MFNIRAIIIKDRDIFMFKDKEQFKDRFIEKLRNMRGKNCAEATSLDIYQVLGTMVRESVMENGRPPRRGIMNRAPNRSIIYPWNFCWGGACWKAI